MKILTIFAVGAALAMAASPASAQESATAAQQTAPTSPAPPSCDAAPYRAFDFWVGEWEVRTPQGQLTGTNSI